MHIRLVQKKKELFSAEFSIVDGNELVGAAYLEGHLGTREGKISIEYQGEKISMIPEGWKQKVNFFRPYAVINGDEVVGIIYQTEYKTGIFNRFLYQQLELDNKVYKSYPIGFGKEGYKNPIYLNEEQCALIEKECEVRDDLHVYELICKDDSSCIMTLIFAMYEYVCGAYRAGEKVKQSIQKSVSISTNKILKSKYDPFFRNRYDESFFG